MKRHSINHIIHIFSEAPFSLYILSLSTNLSFNNLFSVSANMHGVSLIRFVVGVVGNVISAFLFVSPVHTFWRIFKKKSTEEFHPYPYLAGFMNCLLWIFYGLPFVHPDSLLVITINSFGLIMEIIYLALFFIYTSKKKYKWIIPSAMAVEVLVLGIIAASSLHLLHTTTKRSMVVGILCDIFNIVMYASPLSNVLTVFKTKSAEFMPTYLCIAGTLNGVTWLTYAFLKKIDLYIAIGNGIGAAFGFFQLGLICYFGKKKNNEAKNGEKPGNVQLTDIV